MAYEPSFFIEAMFFGYFQGLKWNSLPEEAVPRVKALFDKFKSATDQLSRLKFCFIQLFRLVHFFTAGLVRTLIIVE